MKRPTLSLFFALILVSQAQVKKWPATIAPEPELGAYSVRKIESEYLYETKSYRIQIPQKMQSALLNNFIMSAESTAHALSSFPFSLKTTQRDEKPLIQVCLDQESYASAGGATGTGGFYDGRRDIVIVQWDQLSREPAQSKLLPRPAFDLLVHELTHLGMSDKMWKIEAWFAEGIAEYLAAAHLTKGKFDFRKMESQIRDHIRRQTGLKQQEIPLTNIKKLLSLSSSDWLKRTASLAPREALESYTAALLLTHFAFHGGAERRKEVAAYFSELEKVTLQRDPKPTLFSPEDGPSIERKLQAYWLPKGLKLSFR